MRMALKKPTNTSFGEVHHVPKLCGGGASLCEPERVKNNGNPAAFSGFPIAFGLNEQREDEMAEGEGFEPP